MGDCNCGDKSQEEVVEPTFMDKIRSFFGIPAAVETEDESSAENKSTKEDVSDLANWWNYPQREQFLFRSEMNEDVSGSSNHVNHLNPTEVQGSEDIMGAEGVIWPQFTQNISGQGRTFANTIHPGMVIPNPDNYPTPVANDPWAPWVDVQTYGDIKDVPVQPYPSAMDWATNPENYHNYYSNVWWTPEVAP